MEHVIKALNAILEETHFDFEYREYARYSTLLHGSSRRMSYHCVFQHRG